MSAGRTRVGTRTVYCAGCDGRIRREPIYEGDRDQSRTAYDDCGCGERFVPEAQDELGGWGDYEEAAW